MSTEAFICEGVRTPIGRYAGALSSVRPDDMLAHVLKSAIAQAPSLDKSAINDVYIGCANQAGEDNRNVGRMGVLLSGLSVEIPATTINRLCGSGLDAVALAAGMIRSGEAEIILAGGVESMSRAPFVMPKSETAFSRDNSVYDTTIGWRFVNRVMENMYGIDSMPETAENVAKEFNVDRSDQDKFAFRSQERAAGAEETGRFLKEIAPVSVPQRRGDHIVVDKDEHPRKASMEKLAALPTPFRQDGTVTAGNSSGVNDGAAALIVASKSAVEKYNLKPKARITGYTTTGVEPQIMGIGPAFAVEKLLQKKGLSISDIDLIELNEAFAAQALATLRHLGLSDDADHVNPNGGAIALGHPLGMSGARLALSAAIDLKTNSMSRAVCTMCVGVGQGIALLIERV